MRFADLDGSMIDVYQAVTQMTDESGQAFPDTIDALLDGAIGSQGYYGAFTANMHTDIWNTDAFTWAGEIVASAQARGVPVVSGRQLLTWLDGRNSSCVRRPRVEWDDALLPGGAGVGREESPRHSSRSSPTRELLASLHRNGVADRVHARRRSRASRTRPSTRPRAATRPPTRPTRRRRW